MSHLPTDPTAPREPVRVPRSRPGTVTVAGALMLGGAAAGFLNGVATIIASPGIGREFRFQAAARTDAPAQEIDSLAASLQTLFLISGGVGAALAVVVVALAVGVMRGNITARISALVIVVLGVCCGSVSGLSALGAGAGSTFTVTLGGEQVDASDALSASVPSWHASLSGGLGCLQILGYIAVVVLLFLPASNAYFRRRPLPATPPGDEADGDSSTTTTAEIPLPDAPPPPPPPAASPPPTPPPAAPGGGP